MENLQGFFFCFDLFWFGLVWLFVCLFVCLYVLALPIIHGLRCLANKGKVLVLV